MQARSCILFVNSRITWQACLKIEEELELLTDFEMLLILRKAIRAETCHTMHRYANANDFRKN